MFISLLPNQGGARGRAPRGGSRAGERGPGPEPVRVAVPRSAKGERPEPERGGELDQGAAANGRRPGRVRADAKAEGAAPDFEPSLLNEGAGAAQARAGRCRCRAGLFVKKKRAFHLIHHATRNGTRFLFLECKIQLWKHDSIDNTVKTVAYLRVSTARQDANSQRLAILEYARRQGLRIDDFIEATASARTNAKHRRLDQLMAVLEPGDQLVVSELSRLGRSLGEVVALLDAIAKASVAFVAVKENIRFEGRQDLQTKVMTTLFGVEPTLVSPAAKFVRCRESTPAESSASRCRSVV